MDVRRIRRSAARLTASALAVVALTGSGQAGAQADSAEEARAAAQRAAAAVAALQPRVEAALTAYERSLDALSGRVAASVAADAEADAAAAAARAAERERVNRIRAIYMAGGPAALYGNLLKAASTGDMAQRAAYARQVLRASRREAAGLHDVAAARATEARHLDAAADAGVVTASDVEQRFGELSGLLDASRAALDTLDAQARAQEEAARAASTLRAAAGRVASATSGHTGTASAVAAPPEYQRLYVAAAATCPGVSWTLLSAVGQVESAHGRNASTSYAGAQGPMQFMPATFAAYGVDGDGDGDVDIHDPADAIFSAARYLCDSGAGEGPDGVRRALYAYNHAQWYVDLVLSVAADLEA